MKKLTRFLLSAIAIATGGMLSSYAQATDMGNIAPDASENIELSADVIQPQLPTDQIGLYRVSYMSSQTGGAIRTATVISLTNNGTTPCSTSVDWRIGFGGAVCTTTFLLGPGRTTEHCSRPLPNSISACNSTCAPALTNAEGNAVVGVPSTTSCASIGASARTYYTTGAGDSAISAITDAKILRFRGGNIGD